MVRVLASSAGGPGFNLQQFPCLALNIEKENTGSFSRIKIDK